MEPSLEEDEAMAFIRDMVEDEQVSIPSILCHLIRPGQDAPILIRDIKEAIKTYRELVRISTSPLCGDHIQALTILRDVAVALEMLDNSSVNKSTLLSYILPENFPCHMLHSFECAWILSIQPGFNTVSDIYLVSMYIWPKKN